MTDTDDLDFMYGLLMESNLDLMYLPSDAVAWLYDRPEDQRNSAKHLGVEAHRYGDDIVSSSLLRSDYNVLILKSKSGMSIRVYPDGGYGSSDGTYYSDLEDIVHMMMNREVPDFDPDETNMIVEPSVNSTIDPKYMMFDYPDSDMKMDDLLIDDIFEVVKITEDDNDIFQHGDNKWDINKAWEGIRSGKISGETIEVPISDYAENKLGIDRDKSWDQQQQSTYLKMDHSYARDMSDRKAGRPGLIVQTDDSAYIIDGNHRVAKRYMNGMDTMSFFVVEPGEDKFFRV